MIARQSRASLSARSRGIADAEDLRCRIAPQTPGRKGDRGQQGFQVPRRQVDHEATDPALAHRSELGGDDFEVPVHRQLGLRVEIMEAVPGEGGEVVPQ